MRILVTRPRAQAEPLASRLRALGHEVEVCPLVEVEPLGGDPVDLAPYDWVIVTSANGARELARRRLGAPARLAAVGPGTAQALADAGLRADLVPAVSTQEGLLAELPQPAGRVLIAAGEGARRMLADALGADFVALYRTVPVDVASLPEADIAVVASGSAALALARLRRDLPVVSIGPQTSAAARSHGLHVVAEASTHDLDGLVAAIAAAQ
jgi:uroporphyrinogen-III synthase